MKTYEIQTCSKTGERAKPTRTAHTGKIRWLAEDYGNRSAEGAHWQAETLVDS